PGQAGRGVGGVHAGAGALVERVHVQALREAAHLVVAAGVRVGDAGGQRLPRRVDRDQGGGEGVEAGRPHLARQRGRGEHGGQGGADLLDDLVGIDRARAVGADGEGVRLLVVERADLTPGDVVDRGTGAAGADV